MQKDISDKANISRSFYSLIENGLRIPSIHVAKEIATILDLTLDKFYNLINKNMSK